MLQMIPSLGSRFQGGFGVPGAGTQTPEGRGTSSGYFGSSLHTLIPPFSSCEPFSGHNMVSGWKGSFLYPSTASVLQLRGGLGALLTRGSGRARASSSACRSARSRAGDPAAAGQAELEVGLRRGLRGQVSPARPYSRLPSGPHWSRPLPASLPLCRSLISASSP